MRLSFALALFFACLAGIVALKLSIGPDYTDVEKPPPAYVNGELVPELSDAEMNALALQDVLKH